MADMTYLEKKRKEVLKDIEPICKTLDIQDYDEYDIDRLTELIKADKDSRCIILPCKIGDMIYKIHDIEDKHIARYKITGIHLKDEKGFRGIKREEYLIVRGNGGYCSHIPLKQLGKTAFLSYDEAKKVCKSLKFR